MNVVDILPAVLERFPRLRNPALPEHVEPTGPELDPARAPRGTFGIDARWRTRLVDDPSGLVGPLPVGGSCIAELAPAVTLYVDPDTPARDGDLVLVALSEAAMSKMIADGSRSPAWMEEYRNLPLSTVVVKQLVHRDGRAYLAADGGALLPLGSQILGVIRFVRAPCAADFQPRKVSLSELQAALRGGA